MLRFMLTSILIVVATTGCVAHSSADRDGAMNEKMRMKMEMENNSKGGGAQTSMTCKVCGGTYAQAGNCPKCGLELSPK